MHFVFVLFLQQYELPQKEHSDIIGHNKYILLLFGDKMLV